MVEILVVVIILSIARVGIEESPHSIEHGVG
jgi:hypothetical protein